MTRLPQLCSLGQAELYSLNLPTTFYVLVRWGAPGTLDIMKPTVIALLQPKEEGTPWFWLTHHPQDIKEAQFVSL